MSAPPGDFHWAVVSYIEPIAENILYLAGLLFIVFGALSATWMGVRDLMEGDMSERAITSDMRVRLSESIALGLTFILGAEVVKTFRVPSLMQLTRVAIFMGLREVITFFLDRDSDKLAPLVHPDK